jgi:chaperone modulatory protein CbpM
MTTTLLSRRASANAQGDVSVVTAATVVGGEHPLTADELACACGSHLEWVAQLADAGIIRADMRSARTQWRFRGVDLERALEARRLERDFGAGVDAAALILDMRGEIRRLRGLLQAHGVSQPT